MDPQGKKADRRIVHCLLCEKPQDLLPLHLSRVCMKNSSHEERQAELQRAKDSMKAWTRGGRNWDYNVMCERYPDRATRLALLEDLHTRGFFVANAPNPADLEHIQMPPASAAATEEPASAVEPSSTGEEGSTDSHEDDAGSHDPTRQRHPPRFSQNSVRMNMQTRGLYQKFPFHCKMLMGFKRHLIEVLNVPNCQQEVDNVSRMLRYIQPEGDEVSLDFLTKSTEASDYLRDLKRAKLSPATILNYMKNMMRFVQYAKTFLHVAAKDPDFHRKCQTYIDFLCVMRKSVAKENSKAICQTRYRQFVRGHKSIRECQKVLAVGRKDALSRTELLNRNASLNEDGATHLRFYCEAILILGHFQRPGAVEGMTTADWSARQNSDGRVCVGVSSHTTATIRIATFALTEQEEAMFQAYFEHIRPKSVHPEVDDEDRFFLSKWGRPIASATNDVARLHEYYKCENVTSREIRRVVEAEAANTFTGEQQSGVAHYMAQSTSGAKQHYRMRTLHETVVTSNLLQSLRGSSPEDSADGRAGPSQKRGREEEKETENMTAFLSKFPVTLNGQPPCKRIRVSAGFSEGRVLYDKWRVMQRGMREEHLLSVFVRRAPTVQTVARRIEKEGWSGNTPQAQLVVSKWRPPTQTQVESDPRIIKKVTTQKWSGLTIKDFGEPKGKGVVATKRFSKGSVICDYHGRVITKAEGKRMMQSMDNEMGYLFFFQELCVDAQTFPCECHPHTETVGRLMKHSKKRFNAKPRRCKLKPPQGETDTILLLASKDIEVGEEIRFDYSVCRQSFAGEGLDLEWLDS